MHRLFVRFTDLCLEKQIITQTQVPWFLYALEKRALTVLGAIPFFFLAVILSNLPCALFFFASFYCLRTYIGGFHAKTILGCLVISLLSETAFFLIGYPLLSTPVIFCTVILCVAVIYILAPYNHPNMHLTEEEAAACGKRGCIRALVISVCTIAAGLCGLNETAKGFTLGTALATAMLCLGYIFDRRIRNE